MNNLTTEQFPFLAAAVAAQKAAYRQKSLGRALEIINTYASADSIPNPEFNNAKDALNTVVDVLDDVNGIYSETFREAYHFPKPDYKFDLGFMYANQVGGKLKLAITKKFNNTEWLAIAAEIVVIYDALMAMKDKIVKRKGRSEEEKADDYVPPMPSTVTAVKIADILKSMTDSLTLEYQEIIFNDFVTRVQSIIDNPRKRGDKSPMSFGETILMPLVGEDWDSFNGGYKTLNPNFRDILRTKAHQDADFAQRMFLYKNVCKLAVILEAKGDFTHKIIDGRVNAAGFQGEIVFNFADGTSFTVRNKVIVNVSVHGNAFNQFPTTFHDVTGFKGQPSEEEMIEQFAGVKE